MDEGGRGTTGTTGLVVHRSTSLAHLTDRSIDRLVADGVMDPLATVRIAVQTGGVARWVTHRIAERSAPDGAGICAGIAFPFLGGVIDEAVARAVDPSDTTDPAAWRPDRLVWPLLAVLRDHGDGFVGLHPSLRPGSSDVLDRRTYETARSVADVLDRYVTHAPGLLRAWARGRDGADVGPDGTPLRPRDAWQPPLWRALIARLGDPVARVDRAIARLADPQVALDGTLAPVTVLGVEVLLERHLEVLAALAARTRVELDVVTPSPARWIDRASRPARHPLLVASGRAADRAVRLLAGTSVVDLGPEDAPAATLLARLQRDVREDVALDVTAPPLALGDDDRSVQLHVCHGLARQAEVVRDVVVDLLARDDTLEPRHVLIVTPDVEAAAAVLRPAFDALPAGQRREISVADRRLGASNAVADVLVALLALVPSRVTASQVLDLVARPPVAARFGLDGADLARARDWLGALGIRWGIDGAHRLAHGRDDDGAHTWRSGLDRLLLGVVMADEDDRTVAGLVPFDPIVGDEVERAARLVAAIDTVLDVVRSLLAPRDGASWARDLATALEALVATAPADAWLAREVRTLLDEEVAPITTAVEVQVVASLVGRRAGAVTRAAGYETGAITLCAPIPVRSIPSRVVVLMGFDDQTFPRRDAAPAFDLIAHHAGAPAGAIDAPVANAVPDARDDDRLLLLDAILAATDHLVVTTTGRDPRTNDVLPPAVPVSELTDVLERMVGRDAMERLVSVHPLQPWSPIGYGPDARPGSADPTFLAAAHLLAEGRDRAGVPGRTTWFLADWDPRLAEEAHAERSQRPIAVSALVRTLDRPLRSFVRSTLGLDLDERDTQVTDDEPVALDGLEQFHLAEALLASTSDPDDWRRAVLGRQTGPVGTLGRVALARVEHRVATLRDAEAAALRAIAGDDPAAWTVDGTSRAVEVTVSDAGALWTLEAQLSWREVAGRAVLTVIHPAKAENPAPLLRAWVHHLVATCVLDVPVVTVAVRLGKERGATTDRFDAHVDPDDAHRELARLCRIHDAAHRGPLPLLRDASSAFASTLQGTKGAGRRVRTVDEVDPLLVRVARAAARTAYEAERSGDRDAATGLVLGAVDLDEAIAPFGGWRAFESLALDVWGPVLAPAGGGAGGAP